MTQERSSLTQKVSPNAANCPVCGTALSVFLESGRCGCPNCYLLFGEYLRPLLVKTAFGKHKGRVPESVRREEFYKKARVIEKQIEIALAENDSYRVEKLAAQLRALQEEL